MTCLRKSHQLITIVLSNTKKKPKKSTQTHTCISKKTLPFYSSEIHKQWIYYYYYCLIVSDITGGKHRTYVTCLFDSFWSIGVIIMPVISYYAGSWQNTYLAISLPTCGYIMVWHFIGDSPRWHLEKGNYAKATKILLEAAAVNGNACTSKNDLCTEIRIRSKITDGSRDGQWLWPQLWSNRELLPNIICIHVAWGVFITNLNGLLLNTRAFGHDTFRWNVALTGGCKSTWFYTDRLKHDYLINRMLWTTWHYPWLMLYSWCEAKVAMGRPIKCIRWTASALSFSIFRRM